MKTHHSPNQLGAILFPAAAEQLSSTGRPITDIALNCGFSNPSYFSRQFKEFMGSTPGEYRAIAKTAIPAAASIQ